MVGGNFATYLLIIVLIRPSQMIISLLYQTSINLCKSLSNIFVIGLLLMLLLSALPNEISAPSTIASLRQELAS